MYLIIIIKSSLYTAAAEPRRRVCLRSRKSKAYIRRVYIRRTQIPAHTHTHHKYI